jgi:hypothetical protein
MYNTDSDKDLNYINKIVSELQHGEQVYRMCETDCIEAKSSFDIQNIHEDEYRHYQFEIRVRSFFQCSRDENLTVLIAIAKTQLLKAIYGEFDKDLLSLKRAIYEGNARTSELIIDKILQKIKQV